MVSERKLLTGTSLPAKTIVGMDVRISKTVNNSTKKRFINVLSLLVFMKDAAKKHMLPHILYMIKPRIANDSEKRGLTQAWNQIPWPSLISNNRSDK